MDSSSWLIWSSFISLLGMAVFVFGRKRRLVVPTLVGVTLMIYPYFVSNLMALLGIAVLLIAALVMGSRYEGSL